MLLQAQDEHRRTMWVLRRQLLDAEHSQAVRQSCHSDHRDV
jgi:hypothetical protein